jgi:holo-[acyl-carrier protein] synthase
LPRPGRIALQECRRLMNERIFGIGTDIVEVERIRETLERFGDRFAGRILTDAECEAFYRDARRPHFLARRFAVKEAVAKAFGTGFRDGLRLRDIELRHNALGRPELCYTGVAQTLCREFAISSSHVSVSDERRYAVAFVTLLTRGSAQG